MSFRALLLLSCLTSLTAVSARAQEAKSGYVLDVPVPLTARSADTLLGQLGRLAESAPEGARLDVVLRYPEDASGGQATAFEDALKLARAITGDRFRSVRIISLVQGEVSGHSVLPILASDALLLSPAGVLADATAGESAADETISLAYQSIAKRRGLFPPALVQALVDPDTELAWVSKVDGGQALAAGDQLVKLRETGAVLGEQVWSAAGAPAKIDADRLRSARVAAGIVGDLDDAAQVLDLASISPVASEQVSGKAKAILLDISGSIARNRVRRWISNLSGSLTDDQINTWLVTFDSMGGDIDQSASLSSLFAMPQPPLRSVVGFVRGEARADGALMALSCKPLYMHPDATLGGPGSDAISLQDLDNHAELIESIAENTKRPVGLIRGLLCRDLEVYRFTNKKTGQIRYATADDLVSGVDDPALERQRWERGDRIELADGLTTEQAIGLGLADASSESIEDVAIRSGLDEVPKPVSDRGLVRFVERLGRSQGLMMILLMVGFVALSAEMNAPGMGVPGFLAMVCFGLFFWMNYLAGTAEWLELVLLVLGLSCIALEVFVIPGFGVFGIGGLIMTIAAIVLMSQTFVLPQNSYQLSVITRGLWAALGSLLGLFGGFVLMRQLFPHVPLFRHLVMEMPDSQAIDVAEKLVDYTRFLHQTGITTTSLRPSGKARFGDEIVQIVSDGSMIDKGVQVRVIDVQGAKIVVEQQ
ncbi:nodulation protein NfeD [Roseiconus nitratireducens]|uniref:Nodulation protein NfeD n=1 Tax=Roseiconus nitratireducens TaxID=2605748 RepID=A0A5M6D620_9BACT|nr:NfeD family protein [Roseiconus nitratireducens]KAA5540655.1 nodulation protein NfeD [Roseiconus nitratireducens]